jgi:hypothetical protein
VGRSTKVKAEPALSDYIDEEHCSLCSRMWRSEREAFRANLNRLRFSDPICDPCLLAFFRNIGFPFREDSGTKH